MVEVVATPDCGNAPRREIIKDLVVAIAEKRVDDVGAIVAADVNWTVIGEAEMDNLDRVLEWITGAENVKQVRFGSILTHGREGGVDGEFTTATGQRWAFCLVIGFASTAKTAKIKTVRAYLVEP
ncbi:MAG TPA: hypothetical protein H9902_06440 [Candidatus Stackebrandtia faecavium]|nr:hypothetical protein [Candidatus Stackebrandtia faecavium]